MHANRGYQYIQDMIQFVVCVLKWIFMLLITAFKQTSIKVNVAPKLRDSAAPVVFFRLK